MAPFFRPGDTSGTPLGVVRANLSMETIQTLVSTLSLGQMGYGFLLSHQGMYLSHPLEEYVRKQLTTFDVARQMNDPSRVRVAHLALRPGQSGPAALALHPRRRIRAAALPGRQPARQRPPFPLVSAHQG